MLVIGLLLNLSVVILMLAWLLQKIRLFFMFWFIAVIFLIGYGIMWVEDVYQQKVYRCYIRTQEHAVTVKEFLFSRGGGRSNNH